MNLSKASRNLVPFVVAAGLFSAALLIAGSAFSASSGEPKVIDLTQTACQFVEAENGIDHGYQTAKADDCKAINSESGANRVAQSEVLKLKPGKYVFRVANKNVPYEVGFWLRSEGYNARNPVHKVTKTSVSGGGLTLGKTADYEIELKAGEYVYSCPLNPTPNYRLVVEG